MTTRNRLPVLLALAALAGSDPAAAARVGRLVGKVVGPDGKPLGGVTVTTTTKSDPAFEEIATTDARGLFMVDIEKQGALYTYKLEKAGYVTAVVNETWNVLGTLRREFALMAGGARAPEEPLAAVPLAAATNTAVSAFNEGVKAFQARDHVTATARFEQAVRQDPELRQAWAALAQVHLERKRHREAAEAAEKAIDLGAAGPSILRVRWEAYRSLDDTERARQAREALEKAGRLEEDAKRIHNDGVALVKIGNDAEAWKKFREAAEIDPSLQQAWLAVAVTGLKLGHAAESLAAAGKVLELEPGNAEALRLQYNAALELKDEAKVVDALVALAAIEPASSRDNLYKLARMSFDADQVAEAKDRARKVLAMDPAHPHAHYILGVIAVREGAKADARSHLKAFLRLAPADPDAATAQGLLAHIGG